MNKDSFNKIINLDNDNIDESNIKKSLEYFLTISDERKKKAFLNNFKIAVKYYFENNLKDNIYTYPIRVSNNLNIYKVDRLSYYIYSLYGKEALNFFKINKSENYDGFSIFQYGFKRYRYIVNNFLKNEKNLISKLEIYRKEAEIKQKVEGIDENILKEAYYTYLTINNYCDKTNYQKRINLFMKKYNISKDIFIDYVRGYGILYLNLDTNKIENKITSIIAINKDNSIEKNKKLFCILYKINTITNKNDLENLVISNHISLDIIYSLVKNGYIDKEFYKKISIKVANILNDLNNNYKYIHYSVTLSILENEINEDIIEIIVKNNPSSLIKTEIRKFISSYRASYTSKEKEELSRSLESKISEAKKRINTKERQKRDKEKAKKEINKVDSIDFSLFLDDSIETVNQFCELVSISKDNYYRYLHILETTNNALYLKIKEKTHCKKETTEYFDNVVEVVKKIRNGVEDNDGNIRKLELLDYFLNTKLDYSEFINTYINSGKSDIDSLSSIKNFFRENILIKYSSKDKINIEKELNGTTIFMLNDEPYEVTRKEKEEVINFLQERGIPLYIKVYKQALRRHISGKLILEDDKKMIKKG